MLGKAPWATALATLAIFSIDQQVGAFVVPSARTPQAAAVDPWASGVVTSSPTATRVVRNRERIRCASVAGGAAAVGSQLSAAGEDDPVRMAQIEGFKDKVNNA